MKRTFFVLSLLLGTQLFPLSSHSNGVKEGQTPATATQKSTKVVANSAFEPVTRAFCQQTLDKINELVEKEFWNPAQLPEWRGSLKTLREKILASQNIVELDRNINELIHSLHASHCQFLTDNDETYFFLPSLLNHARTACGQNKLPPTMDYIGAITGGLNCKTNQVRYVLTGSPAAIAGIRLGDEIEEVNGRPYIGQLSFVGTAGTTAAIKILRHQPPQGNDESSDLTSELTLKIKPIKAFDADEYNKATKQSFYTENSPEGTIGYIHLWSGGAGAHDVLEELLSSEKVQATDGLIFDMRDGYGGAFFNDLDFFYRSPKDYPTFVTVNRAGKKQTDYLYYNKPVVALINGGSRSGKELLAFSLKQSGRAILVGETTAGMVLAGRLFPINNKSALYLAVMGAATGGKDLEAKGVSPDVEVKTDCIQRGIKDVQLDEAKKILRVKLAESKKLSN